MDQFKLINIKLYCTFYMKLEPRCTVSRCINRVLSRHSNSDYKLYLKKKHSNLAIISIRMIFICPF